jgi:DNA-3-methyladenine glycosylase
MRRDVASSRPEADRNAWNRRLDPVGERLGTRFFNRDAEVVALDLIGCVLVRRRGQLVSYKRITETEAYVGPHDLACHAAKGRTKRTEVMFGPAGTLYVYMVYGMHWMLNVVTGPVDYPAAVLIRSLEGVTGPGRLTKALGITSACNGLAATEPTGVWFTKPPRRPSRAEVTRAARVGVGYAGPLWSNKQYRFVWDGD